MNSINRILVSRGAHKKKCCVLFLLALCLVSFPLQLSAQVRSAQSKAPLNTQYSTANGIDDLYGVDPSKDVCTTGRPTGDVDKVFYLYNIGTGQFLNIGGLWGTHASINSTPNACWLEATNTDGQYYLNNRIDGSGTGTYMGVTNGNLNMDRNTSNASCAFSFEKADAYSDTYKAYRIKVVGNGQYVTTFPSNQRVLCNITAAYSTSDPLYKNQVWKLISRGEYYKLALANPATMKAIVDFSFVMQDPNFRINNTDAANWHLGRQGGAISENTDQVRLGDATMYCTFGKRASTGQNHFNNYVEAHQRDYGKYAYCYSKQLRNFYMYQEFQVHKSGWYVLRCNGFSTQQTIEGEDKPLAYLFVSQMKHPGGNSASVTLNVVSPSDAQTFEKQSDGAGIGVAFFEGEYENQVQLCVELGDDGKTDVSQANPATLRVGYYVAPGSTDISADEMTAVDNFKLLYAGPRRNPELILNEDYTDLKYLTLAKDNYTNSVLHLKRKFNAHQWNSLILPVDVTLGQMKRTFGDAVKVAKLKSIDHGVVFFETQEPTSDDDVLVKAFEPYIVYPPVVNVTSQSYTADKFYTSAAAEDNSEWLDANYEPTSDPNVPALTKTIGDNHYIIPMVSLDREQLLNHVEATKKDDLETWISNTSFSASAAMGDMTCCGTLAKTYDDKGKILPGRDDLEEDYCMINGKLVQVPSNKVYGLDGFRCWFEVKGRDAASSAKLALNVDGVEEGTTSIADVLGDEASFTSRGRGIDGVFSLNGQRVRGGSSVVGLPKGIYITNGRKIVVR